MGKISRLVFKYPKTGLIHTRHGFRMKISNSRYDGKNDSASKVNQLGILPRKVNINVPPAE